MEKGLTSLTAKEKLKIFGKNKIKTQEPVSAFSLFLSQFPTFINAVLAGAAFLSFFLGNIIDGIFILIILFLNALFGFVQEYRAEKSLEKLKKLITPFSRVIRDGKEIKISTEDLVPQDLVVLSEGDSVPSDGKLLSTHYIEIDESILTGESLSVIKKQNDQAFGGTFVVKGKGYLMLEKTGMNTRFGQIAKTLSSLDSDKSPLQIQLGSLAKTLSFIAIIISLSLIPIGILQGKTFLPLMLLAVSIGIAAIPEGLPAIITVALAIGTNRMAHKNAIVRKMQSVETLGSIQIVLIDKTGTLTQNLMKVKKFWLYEKDCLPQILNACVFANTASLVAKNEFPSKGGPASGWDTIGDRTDGALLLFAQSQLKDLDSLKQDTKIIEEHTFDPETKTVTVVLEKNLPAGRQGSKQYVYVRGAPEQIIEKSNLNDQEKKKIIDLYEAYAKEGLRVIGFANKIQSKDGSIKRKDLEKNLNFLGFIGIYDPPRPESKQAIKDAKLAGIKVIMVTGDNELTALTIAKEIGLIEKDEDVFTGSDLEKITDEELEKDILKIRIFARSRPEDKLRLVSILKRMGYVVGVTGDGVNDSLALKRADVGIAMGETGTDVAKEASDIVLTDDNFSTIVNAIEEGRTIYNNILKSITYLLSGNIAELSIVFFAFILGMPNPFVPTQILWLNLVTDGLPALALASDIKNRNVLKHSPRNSNESILSKNRSLFIIGFGLILAVSLLTVFKFLLITHNEIFARTVIFNLLVVAHLGIIFLVRKESVLKMNKFLAITILITIIMQVSVITIPFFREIFHLTQ